MRRRNIATGAIAAALAAMALLPVQATANPGYYKVPPSHILQLGTRGSHGYTIFLAVVQRWAILSAMQMGPGGDYSSVAYRRKIAPARDDDLALDLGRAGHFDGRFDSGKVEEIDPANNCKGGPTVVKTGSLVGSFDFHGRGGFTSLHAHRLSATVTTDPPRVCRGRSPWAGDQGHRVDRIAERERQLVAGRASGTLRFSATTGPPLGNEPAQTFYAAESRRREGPVTVRDSVAMTGPATSFAVPMLTQLPTTATVEPPAPFEGSATFGLPSRRTAVLSGDLRVDLPEVGKVTLTTPGADAGVCQGYVCTKSLPKALQPQRLKYGLAISISQVEFQTIR
jgi:hypothetical protein